jgi:hypothetical protein
MLQLGKLSRKRSLSLLAAFTCGICFCLTSKAGAAAIDYYTYYTGGDSGQPPIAFNQGIMPFSNFTIIRHQNCFDPIKPDAPTAGGPAQMNFYVVESSIWSQVKQERHLTQGFGLKAPKISDAFGGEAKFDSSVSSNVESTLSEDSVVLVLEVNASTGSVQSDASLNDNGKAQLKAGRLNFLQQCGVMFATREDLGVNFYIVVAIHTSSAEAKSDILTSIGYDGSLTVYGVNANAKVIKTLDEKTDQKSSVTSFDVSVSTRSGEPLEGMGELLSGLQNITQSPLQNAITAASKFLIAHNKDPGVVDTIHLDLVSNLISSDVLAYSNFDTRVDFAEKVVNARPAIEALHALAEPSKTIPAPSSPTDRMKRYILTGAHNYDCKTWPHSSWNFVDSIVCQHEDRNRVIVDFDKLLSASDKLVNDCMYANDDKIEEQCNLDNATDALITLGGLFPSAAGGLRPWLSEEQIGSVKQQFPGVDVDKILGTPDQLATSAGSVIRAVRKILVSNQFPELASIETFAAIYTTLSESTPDDNDPSGLRVPPFARSMPRSTDHQRMTPKSSCGPDALRAFLNDKLSGKIDLDGTLDVSNLNYDIELWFTGPHEPDQLKIETDKSGQKNTLILTWVGKNLDVDKNDFVPNVEPWIYATCETMRDSLPFDLRGKLLELGGTGRISESYFDLHGHHTVTIETYKVESGKLFLTNVFP